MIDFYKVLGCTPDTLTDDDIEDLKTLERVKSYPPRFKLIFSPTGPENESTQVKLYLHGLNNVSPITVRLDKENSGIDINDHTCIHVPLCYSFDLYCTIHVVMHC